MGFKWGFLIPGIFKFEFIYSPEPGSRSWLAHKRAELQNHQMRLDSQRLLLQSHRGGSHLEQEQASLEAEKVADELGSIEAWLHALDVAEECVRAEEDEKAALKRADGKN